MVRTAQQGDDQKDFSGETRFAVRYAPAIYPKED